MYASSWHDVHFYKGTKVRSVSHDQFNFVKDKLKTKDVNWKCLYFLSAMHGSKLQPTSSRGKYLQTENVRMPEERLFMQRGSPVGRYVLDHEFMRLYKSLAGKGLQYPEKKSHTCFNLSQNYNLVSFKIIPH